MEKEKALENVKNLVSMFPEYKETLETLLPEIRKVDDQTIKNEIVDYLRTAERTKDCDRPKIDRWIAWIQNAPVSECDAKKDYRLRDTWEYIDEFIKIFGRIPKDIDELSACVDYVMKSKPSDNERVIIPKFKPGDEIKLNGSNLKLEIGHIENGRYYAKNKSWSIGIEAADDNYELINSANPEPRIIEKAVNWLKDTLYFQNNSSGRGEDYEITTNDFDSMEDFIDSFCNYVKTGNYRYWRPTADEMGHLKEVIDTCPINCRQQAALESLFNDLKKR